MRTSYIFVVLVLAVGGCGDDDDRREDVGGSKVSESRTTDHAPIVYTQQNVNTQPHSDPPMPPLVRGGSQEPSYLPPLTRGGLEGSERGEALPDKQARTVSVETQPADVVPAFQPLLNAHVGEWASYAGLDARALRYEIAQVDGETIRTRVIVYEQGKPLGQPATREDARELDPLARQASTQNTVRQVNRVRMTVLGRNWDALLFEDRWIDEEIQYVRRTWVSTDVPVFGLLRMEMYGDDILEASMELTDFGESAEVGQ